MPEISTGHHAPIQEHDMNLVHNQFGHVFYENGDVFCTAHTIPIADRIVACVNACAGVPDEVLMQKGVDGWVARLLDDCCRLYNERDRLKAQNAELRKALIKYGRHDPRCPAKITEGECDCGFDDAVGL
jgi:hypothetical protein